MNAYEIDGSYETPVSDVYIYIQIADCQLHIVPMCIEHGFSFDV